MDLLLFLVGASSLQFSINDEQLLEYFNGGQDRNYLLQLIGCRFQISFFKSVSAIPEKLPAQPLAPAEPFISSVLAQGSLKHLVGIIQIVFLQQQVSDSVGRSTNQFQESTAGRSQEPA